MNEFPSYGKLKECKFIRKKEPTIEFFDSNSEETVQRSCVEAIDPTEVMFREILFKVANMEKQIKNFSCPKLKQTTVFNSCPSKQKPNSNYVSKKVKKN
jgi:hypothetical protein